MEAELGVEKRRALSDAERKRRSRNKMKEQLSESELEEHKKKENERLRLVMSKKRQWKKENLTPSFQAVFEIWRQTYPKKGHFRPRKIPKIGS